MSENTIKEGYFITGGLGCIGVWIVRNLIKDGKPVTIFDLDKDLHRLTPLLTDQEIDRINFVTGDLTDYDAVEGSMKESGAKHIIHLAALQVPLCMQNPRLGALVNVVGTINMYEAALKLGHNRMIFASSAAVYGMKEDYAPGLLPHDAKIFPRTHYGIYKQCNEGNARVYYQDKKITSIGLRPYTVYGPGRDVGITSFPSQAMIAAACGKEFAIPYGGKLGMQHVDDVAKVFIMATELQFEGFEMFNIKGQVADMTEIVAAIEKAEPSIKGKIKSGTNPIPSLEGLDDDMLIKTFGQIPNRSLEVGVAETIAIVKKAIAEGRM